MDQANMAIRLVRISEDLTVWIRDTSKPLKEQRIPPAPKKGRLYE
jgi:hypothetical protein